MRKIDRNCWMRSAPLMNAGNSSTALNEEQRDIIKDIKENL